MMVATLGLLVRVAKSMPPRVKVPATPGVLADDVLDLARGRIGALHGGGVGKADGDEDGALVLLGQETAGEVAE